MPYRSEVLPYQEAAWAAKVPEIHFRWAWRILNDAGETRASGVSNAPENDVRKLAESAAKRLQSYQAGEAYLPTITTKHWARRNGRRKVA